MRMRSLVIAVGCGIWSVTLAGAGTVAKDEWPATPVGQLARGWVGAFSTGEDSMRTFLERHMAPKSLAERGTRVRVEKYRALRERYGKLQLAGVVKSAPTELTVKLIDSDAREHEFVFASEVVAPYRLQTVSIRETQGIHGMFGGFHHE